MRLIKGSCLCGGVKYEAKGELRDIVACHCTQCRKSTGHYGAATQGLTEDLNIVGSSLTWFRSSETAERGFCRVCGGNLFWRSIGSDRISIWAGTIDGPTGLKMTKQLYAQDAGDYYELPLVPIVRQSTLMR